MSSKFRDYRQTAIDLVEAGGGIVTEGLFVEEPGVLLLSDKNGITEEAMQLFQKLNLDLNQNKEDLLAEFAALITYLSYHNDPKAAEDWAQKIHKKLKEAGHRSPYKVAGKEINFLVAGISVETILELACHSRFKIGRLCSSRTAAMDSPLYRTPGNDYLKKEIKAKIRADRERHAEWMSSLDRSKTGLSTLDFRELTNMGHTGYKAGYAVVGTTPEDLDQILIGRLDEEGVELELRHVCERVANMAQASYPDIIKTVAEYYATNPNAKEITA